MDACLGWMTPFMLLLAVGGAAVVIYTANWSLKGFISYEQCKNWERLNPEVVGDEFAKAYPSAKYAYHDIQKSWANQSRWAGLLLALLNTATTVNLVLAALCAY